jgi:charged multivesicular body protein 3
MVKAVGHLAKSTEVMAAVSDLIKIPEMTETMREMSKEMMKVSFHLRDNYVDDCVVLLISHTIALVQCVVGYPLRW